uniref:C-type lectin domain-containing protein n=1 Tax=Ditylenchus dipsaci TaxID=166011 RepID=A0A915CQ31_9BILA
MESMEVVDSDALKHGYKFHNPVSADLNNPWISGPYDKKFQFHVGQQSWLSAREMCLSQNSDLVTIQSDQELDWILSHYKPQGRHLRERQIQVGLFVDPSARSADASMREWRWVNQHPLNSSMLPWTSGEPFDHSLGKERCALLNVNERRIDDVDCDLGGGPMHFYRYVCERTHDNHIKHEELNNPLWKKLEDILVFFGISTASKTINRTEELGPGEDEEDYWEKAGNPLKVSVTTLAPSANRQNADKDAALNTDEKKEAEKTAEILLTSASDENSQILATNSSTQQETNATLSADLRDVKQKELDEKANKEVSKENETEPAKQTKIVAAHGTRTLTLENSEASVPALNAPVEPVNSREIDLDQLAPKRLIEQKAPELTIANDLSELETASLETTRTTKADPLANLAETLERTFAAVSSDDVNKTESQASAPATALPNPVQKMIAIQETPAVKQGKETASGLNDTLKAESPERPLDAAASLLTASENSSATSSSSMSIVAIIQATNITDAKAKHNLLENQSESAQNMEDDFLKAADDTKSHPNINSGDLIISPNTKDDEIIGSCGDPSHKHSEQDLSIFELEPDLQANDTVSQQKKVKIDKFLRSLRTFLDSANPSQLKRLVDDGKSDKRPLVERLEQVVAMKKAVKNAEDPAEELKKLHEEKVKKEKKTEVEADLAADLQKLKPKSSVPESELEENAPLTNPADPKLQDSASSKLDYLSPVQIQQLQTYSAINHLSSPTQEIIDAVLALQNHSPSINRPLASEVAQKNVSNFLVLNPSIGVLSNESVLQQTVTEEKYYSNISGSEAKDLSSVFPHPDFTLLNTNETLALAREVEEKVKAERKRVDGTYHKFLNSFTTIENNNKELASATNDFIKRIQTADTQRLIVKQSPSVEFRRDPGHIDTNVQGIMIEKNLDGVFENIGDNFNKLIG